MTASRLVGTLLAFLLLVTAASAGSPPLSSLESRIALARQREAQLSGRVAGLTTRIRTLELRVGDVSSRLASLETDLGLHRRRLDAIDGLLKLQASQLGFLRGQYAIATSRLSRRLVRIYESDQPSPLEIIVGAVNLGDAIDRLDYAKAIAEQDRQIVAEVADARARVKAARARARVLRSRVAASARIVAYRTGQVRALRDQLVARRGLLASARSQSGHALADTRHSEQQWIAEADAIRAESAALAQQIAAQKQKAAAGATAQTTSLPPSSAGLIWPVQGPITSPFGMRWGSLHPGLDIGAAMGTPIEAAASGTVIVAAYAGGYGNLIVIDHGNGLATAYAHQSRLAATLGEQVAQGQVIGYVGSTGFSTGPHLHFEVRVNGVPVDPLGYL